MQFKLCVLAGSSKGNSIFLKIDNERFLIDAGISNRRLEKALKDLKEPDPSNLTGILITHEHTDHIKGLKTLAKKHHVKCWLTFETYRKIRPKTGPIDTEFIEIAESFTIGTVEVLPYEIPHDAVDPVAYVIKKGNLRIGILLDCGKTSTYLYDGFRDLDVLIIEANHSFDQLLSSDYSTELKTRILSVDGHLSNWHAAEFVNITKPKIVVITHISENNNSPEIVLSEIEELIDNNSDNYKPFMVIVPSDGRGAIITQKKQKE
ncbi:MAG: MBL fold metallo-hydrolase [Candidatus Hodarchaeales archaeon]